VEKYLLEEVDGQVSQILDLVWPETLFFDLTDLETHRRFVDDNVDFD